MTSPDAVDRRSLVAARGIVEALEIARGRRCDVRTGWQPPEIGPLERPAATAAHDQERARRADRLERGPEGAEPALGRIDERQHRSVDHRHAAAELPELLAHPAADGAEPDDQ